MERCQWVRRILLAASLAVAFPTAVAAGEDAIESIAVGDFDGDGTPDVALGMPALGSGKLEEAGEIRIFSGKTGALLRRIYGKAKEECRGQSLAAIGDIDGDGATDLASGFICEVPAENAPEVMTPSGKVDVLSGTTGASLKVYGPRWGESFSSFGIGVCALGDGTGRARVDFVIHDGMKGRWVCVTGANGKMEWSLTGEPRTINLMHNVGDVDGDTLPDLGIGAFLQDVEKRRGAGRLQVLSGRYFRSGHRPHELLLLEGSSPGEAMGLNVAPAGDWNGDRKGDLLVGRSGSDAAKGYPWLVRVLSGADGSEIWRVEGAKNDVSFGGAIAVADLDGDGRREFAAGHPGRNRKAGAVALITSKDAKPLWTVDGAGSEGLGEELVSCPDADGDGVADLVVLAPGARVDSQKGKGRVRILSGKDGKTITLINPLDTK